MADLDTRSKRASSVGIVSASTLSLVLPDGTIDQGDRQHIAFSYSGISSGAGPSFVSAWAINSNFLVHAQ